MKVLFDTNVILDLLLEREPFSEHAAYLISKVEEAQINGFLCANTITTIHYLITKTLGKHKAKKYIELILSLFEIAPVNRHVLDSALKNNNFNDFEDAVLHESAVNVQIDFIVTRNIKDFKYSKIPVYEPQDFIKLLNKF